MSCLAARLPLNVIVSGIAMALLNLLLLALTYLALSPFAAFAGSLQPATPNSTLFVLVVVWLALTLIFALKWRAIIQGKNTHPIKGEAELLASKLLADVRSASPIPNRTDTGKKSILVVEDDNDLREHIAEHFTHKYQVYTAADGKAAFELIERHKPSLILSDVSMPKMDGLTLCKKVKQSAHFNHIPVVLLSGQSEKSERLKGLQCGATDYLTKPFYSQELQLKINNLLDTCDKQQRLIKGAASNLSDDRLAEFNEKPCDGFLQKAYDVLEKHHSNSQFGVDELAYELSISRRHLLRKIKTLTGQSPVKLISEYRLAKAAKKLLQSPHSISQVAYAVGFESPAHFSRTFKSQFGVAPSQYRAETQ